MANPNPNVWGAPETWANAKIQVITTSSFADVLKCNPVKIANFGGNDNFWRGSLGRGLTAEKIAQQHGIDKTVCPCGQDFNVSAFGKIAMINENSELAATPTRIIVRDKNVNWCFCELQCDTLSVPNHFSFIKTFNWSNYDNKSLDQFAPDATYGTYNKSVRQVPYLSYQINSLVLGIQVYCITQETATNLSATWRYLDDWKNNYSSQPICGLRVVVMGVNTINTTNPITIQYYNSTSLSQYSNSGLICVLDTINTPNRQGVVVDTSFYAIYSYGDNGTCGYFFMPTYLSKNYNVGVFPAWDMFSGQQLKRHSVSESQATYYYSIPYSDDNYNTIMKMVACFGCYFTPTSKYQFRYDMLDTDLYLPIIDDNGVTHGGYTRGTANATNPLYAKTSIRDIDYNPDTPPVPVDTNTYSVTTGFNTVGNVASTTKAYVVNGAALTGLSGEMWNIINSLVTTPEDMTNLDNLTLDAFLTNNPIDAIVSVKKFPLSSVPHAENLEHIYLGKYQTGAAGYALALQQARYNFEGIPIFPKFGNCFLDYAPYTKMQLYVPFCGTIEIDAADFMGRTLSVEMVIDFITGAVTAYVLANQLVVTSLTGNCGIDIAVTGTEQSTVSAALENAIIQDKSARGSYTLKGSVGGMLINPIGNLTHPSSAIENRFNTKLQKMQANYNLQHVEIPLRQIGQASPLNSWALEFVCRLIIYYPDGECITFNATNEPTLDDDKVKAFGAVNGFATVETNTLSRFEGFTQVSDADLSGVSATDTEKEMILSLLHSGVYL